ncbi:MAG: 4Fe-4S binding protein, partial [Clostridia bacterium]|nr:4Fe-4S binding protein [Clostridia bacterium]
DVYTGPSFCIDAIAAGTEGAVSLNRAVRKGHSLVIGRDRRIFKAIDKDNALIDLGYDKTPRQVPQHVGEYAVLTQEQVAKETARCLSCGAARVDEHICIGCGLCTTRCKFDAIHLTKHFDTRGCTYEELIPEVIKHVGVIAKNIATGKTEEDLYDA